MIKDALAAFNAADPGGRIMATLIMAETGATMRSAEGTCKRRISLSNAVPGAVGHTGTTIRFMQTEATEV